jgi:Domain of unknown function (DUF1963)
MTDDEIRAHFTIVDRDSVRFEPVFPPSHAIEPTTYFGGLPRLPAHLPWPEVEGTALTFVGQIDLSQMPSGLTLDVPKIGTLFFFVDLRHGETLSSTGAPGKGGTTIYWDQSTKDLPVRPEPANLGPCFGEDWPYYFEWLTHLGPLGYTPPKTFPRFEMGARALRAHDLLYTGPRRQILHAGDPADLRAQKEANNDLYNAINAAGFRTHYKLHQASLEASAAPPIERNYFILPDFMRPGPGALKTWRGGDGYPYSWLDVEIFFGLLLKQINEHHRRIPTLIHALDDLIYYSRLSRFSRETRNRALKFVKALATHVRTTGQRRRMNRDLIAIESEIVAWLKRATAAGRWSPVPADGRAAFLRWYDEVASRASDEASDPRHWVNLSLFLRDAFRIGPRMCLAQSREAARLIPESWRENQSWQWATNLAGHGERFINHQLLGSRGVDPLTTSPTDVPLMTFDSQDGFSCKWGADDGSITFWIDLQDLAARDFTKTYVTILCS